MKIKWQFFNLFFLIITHFFEESEIMKYFYSFYLSEKKTVKFRMRIEKEVKCKSKKKINHYFVMKLNFPSLKILKTNEKKIVVEKFHGSAKCFVIKLMFME
jgi:hypothetical protein